MAEDTLRHKFCEALADLLEESSMVDQVVDSINETLPDDQELSENQSDEISGWLDDVSAEVRANRVK